MTARPGIGLAGRLFVAQALVVLTGMVTLGLVAAVIGPVIFHDHLHRVAAQVSAETSRHVEEAFASASAVSSVTGLAAALVAALTASALVARRVARPVTELARAATDIADGHHGVHVTTPALGKEFDALTTAFNAMATRLRDTEATRRRILADLGHELRTPLATIEAYLDAVEDGIIADGGDTLTVLRTQTARLRRLSEDISAVSRAEEHRLDLRPVRIHPPSWSVPRRQPSARASTPRASPCGNATTATSHISGSTRSGWDRFWATCWTTPCATPRPEVRSPSPSPRRPAPQRDRWCRYP